MLQRGRGKRERQAAIYLLKALSGRKNAEVGKDFGIKVAEMRIKGEKNFRNEIDKLKGVIIEK